MIIIWGLVGDLWFLAWFLFGFGSGVWTGSGKDGLAWTGLDWFGFPFLWFGLGSVWLWLWPWLWLWLGCCSRIWMSDSACLSVYRYRRQGDMFWVISFNILLRYSPDSV